MGKGKKLMRMAGALILSASILSGAAFGAQPDKDGQTIDPGAILSAAYEKAKEIIGDYSLPDFEGDLLVTAADGMRTAIADHFFSQDDMSWVENADLFVQGKANDTGGADLEATFSFDGTRLYHLQASFDASESILYLECPELKDQVFAFPVGDFSADAQTITGKKITPEKIADYMTVLKEFNDLVKSISLDTLKEEWEKYVRALGEYIQTEKGFAAVTAGSLSTEGNTTTWTISADDLEELIPKALLLLSEDDLLKQIMESSFADHVMRLVVGEKAAKLFPKGVLWPFVQQTLVQASEEDYAKGRSVSATIAQDQNGLPIHLSVSMEKSGMKAELVNLSVIIDGADHAFEGKVGPMLLKTAGIKTNHPCGLVIQGNLKDDILKEVVSVHVNGVTMPVLMIRNLDLLAIRDAWLFGDIAAIWKDTEYECEFFTDEDGLRTMRFYVDGEEWFTLTADLKKVDSTDLDEFDLSDAFLVDSRKAFFKYMRDASAIRMFEKLASAGVPQEYVDMLTDGEAATESSRENTVEIEEE